MTSASPSPKSPELSEKSKKYDRQLRLWGDHGQSDLEGSKICLINANATGTEILKSLILPSIGSFTIVDSHFVTLQDVGSNFFLESDSVGKNRGECAKLLLLELNPDVNGESIDSSPEKILEQDNVFFNNYSVVIASQLDEKTLISLSKALWANNVPFIYTHSVGLLSWVRLQFQEHTIVESHPDSSTEDFRLDAPFPELRSYMQSILVTDRDDALKTPWLILLYKGIEAYMAVDVNNSDRVAMDTNSKTHPCYMNSKEKRDFKIFLKTYLEGLGLHDSDEVYEETLKGVNTALHKTSIPENTAQVLKDVKACMPDLTKFWLMCHGLKEFVGAHSVLPVRGTLPDMTADSKKYISLQNIYREKARRDADDVFGFCQQFTQCSRNSALESLRHADVKTFCRESYNLRVLYGSAFFEELESKPTEVLNELSQNIEDFDENKMFYLLLRATLRFNSEYNIFPGALNDYEPDIIRFKQIVNKMLNEWNSSLAIKEDFIHEVCRSGAAELPSVAAFIGGCVAQEVIKLITSQYVPLNNTLIYNAITSTTSSFDASTKLNM